MIFYHPDCDLRFSDYGIEIPIVDDRAALVFSSLKYLYPFLEFTDLSKITPVTRTDLERVHRQEFLDHLFGTAAERQGEIYQCYELVNAEGNFERYNLKIKNATGKNC